jgi:7-cyano-7-deazaguanine synthase
MNTYLSDKALVVLSGGQDSTTCLWWAKKYFEEVHAITFDYNQRHHREITAAKTVARLAGVKSHEVLKIGPILAGRSPLTNDQEQLETYKDYSSMDAIIGDRVELTFVPMRNALFLTLAANRAVCAGIDYLVTGVCQADNANYPDCRLSFIDSQKATIRQALGNDRFEILTPLIDMTKDQSIHLSRLVGAYITLAFSHTAYDGNYPPNGKDHASILRGYGFEQAGLPDPLVVRAWSEGLMELPNGANYTEEKVLPVLEQINAASAQLETL